MAGAELDLTAAHSLASQELGGGVRSLDWGGAEGRSDLEAAYLEMTQGLRSSAAWASL